jgi:hypothetical protein
LVGGGGGGIVNHKKDVKKGEWSQSKVIPLNIKLKMFEKGKKSVKVENPF